MSADVVDEIDDTETDVDDDVVESGTLGMVRYP